MGTAPPLFRPYAPFVPAHLHHAVKILAETADGIDNELAVKLGGRTTFDDHDEDP